MGLCFGICYRKPQLETTRHRTQTHRREVQRDSVFVPMPPSDYEALVIDASKRAYEEDLKMESEY